MSAEPAGAAMALAAALAAGAGAGAAPVATAGGPQRPSTPQGGALHWSCLRFADLGVDNLYDLLALRCQVFIVEQVPYLDPDGVDRHAAHLLGRDADGTLQAYLRVVDPGIKYTEPSLGRVATRAAVRGTGLGHVLVAEGVARCVAAWPGQGIRISAQAHLARFYGAYGFVGVGQTYLEDNIPHLEMLRAP